MDVKCPYSKTLSILPENNPYLKERIFYHNRLNFKVTHTLTERGGRGGGWFT
jgi:hypothetical protein